MIEKVEEIQKEEQKANQEDGKEDSRKDASRMSKLVEELIGTLQVCNSCTSALTEDERIINARFIQQAANNNQDISMFPICVKCNFE